MSTVLERCSPEIQRVYRVIADHPEGITSRELAEAIPELDATQRGVAVRKLRERGYLARSKTPGCIAIWRVR